MNLSGQIRNAKAWLKGNDSHPTAKTLDEWVQLAERLESMPHQTIRILRNSDEGEWLSINVATGLVEAHLSSGIVKVTSEQLANLVRHAFANGWPNRALEVPCWCGCTGACDGWHGHPDDTGGHKCPSEAP